MRPTEIEDLKTVGTTVLEELGPGPADYSIGFNGTIRKLNAQTVHQYRECDSIPDEEYGQRIMIEVIDKKAS